MIGGEGPANPVWMHQGNWIDLAKKFNAYLFYLEHRFYGKSHPTQSLDVSYLAYLSSEQALSDLAYFVTKMKAKLQMKKSRWIAFGGSYPGNLAAWARLKYPHLIHAAIASSAPVQAKLNFKDYLASVSISLGDKCSQAINIATKEIEKRILNNERKSLRKDLKLCDDIYLKETNDVSNLFETLAGNFEGIVQYNKGNRKFEGAKGTNLTIDLICNTLTLYPGKEYEQYQDVTRIILEAYNQSCLDFKYSKMLKDMRKTSWNSSVSEGGRQWLYQTCTEFGYYQTSDNLNQPFGKNFSLEFSTKQCRDIFGKKFTDSSIKDGIKATNINYGGLSFKASRVLFVNGAIDPWHVLSFTKSVRPGKENRVEAVLIPNTSHCADMYPSRDEDTNELKEARQVILQTISRWLKKKA